jgi:hypothetical protein
MSGAKKALTLQLKPASCVIQNASFLKLISPLSVSVTKLAAPSCRPCCSTTDLVHETYRRAPRTHATRCLMRILLGNNTILGSRGGTASRDRARGKILGRSRDQGLMYRHAPPLLVRFWFHSVDGSSATTPHHSLLSCLGNNVSTFSLPFAGCLQRYY